jgi:hypothetical protein
VQIIANQRMGIVLTRQSRRGRRILLVSALLLAVGGCNAIGGAFSSVSSSVKGAVFPGGDEQNTGRSTTTAQAAPAPAASNNAPAPLGSGTSDERIERLEQEVTALRAELAQLKPSIERLVGIEGDIRVLLTQLSRLTGPDGGTTETATNEAETAETDTGSAAAPAQAPNPPALQPVEQAQPAPAPGQPQSLRPLQPVQAATAAPAPAAPTQLTSISPSVAPAEQVSVHLASFRGQDSARQGWRELQATHSDLLGGLDYRISPVQLSGGRGTFYRVKAGPFTDTASAEEICRLMKSRNAYCVLSDFTGSK